MSKRSSTPREVRTETPTLRPEPDQDPPIGSGEEERVLKVLVDIENKLVEVHRQNEELMQRALELTNRMDWIERQGHPPVVAGPFVRYRVDENTMRLGLIVSPEEPPTVFVFGYGKSGYVVLTASEGEGIGQWSR